MRTLTLKNTNQWTVNTGNKEQINDKTLTIGRILNRQRTTDRTQIIGLIDRRNVEEERYVQNIEQKTVEMNRKLITVRTLQKVINILFFCLLFDLLSVSGLSLTDETLNRRTDETETDNIRINVHK